MINQPISSDSREWATTPRREATTFFYRGARPRGVLTPYPFIYHIDRIGTSFLYLLLTYGTPLTVLRGTLPGPWLGAPEKKKKKKKKGEKRKKKKKL